MRLFTHRKHFKPLPYIAGLESLINLKSKPIKKEYNYFLLPRGAERDFREKF